MTTNNMVFALETWMNDRKKNRFVADLEKVMVDQYYIRTRDKEQVKKVMRIVVDNTV